MAEAAIGKRRLTATPSSHKQRLLPGKPFGTWCTLQLELRFKITYFNRVDRNTPYTGRKRRKAIASVIPVSCLKKHYSLVLGSFRSPWG